MNQPLSHLFQSKYQQQTYDYDYEYNDNGYDYDYDGQYDYQYYDYSGGTQSTYNGMINSVLEKHN